MSSNNIYNIPSYLPFSDILATYLLEKTKDNPHSLTKYKLLLPTRRACRILQDTFLRLNNGKPMLLPHLLPIGEVDEGELSLLMIDNNSKTTLEIPSAITPLKRQLLLAKLIMQVPEFKQGFDGALGLSKALCQFIDQVAVEGVDFSDLHNIVPEEFAAHWQVTLDFLKIISEHWPKILKDNNLIDVAERRNLLLQNMASYWSERPPDYPVIAAGSTGSIPAVAKLLKVISNLPQGKVVLPALDMQMEPDSWEVITEIHPQYSLKKLLNYIGVDREDVSSLIDVTPKSERYVLASAMMSPAEFTHKWKGFSHENNINSMLDGLEYYSCKTPHEEAGVIALIMRESLEESGKTISLVTPDRDLARRVKSLCKRWSVDVDDSAGENLIDTKLGKFILLTLDAVKRKFDSVSFLSLLKTGLCQIGYPSDQANKYIKALEIEILRSGEVISTHEMLRKKIDLMDEDSGIGEYIDKLYEAVLPLYDLSHKSGGLNIKDMLAAHVKALEKLAESENNIGCLRLWKGDIGKAASLFFSDLLEHAHLVDDLSYEGYCKIVLSLMHDITVRVPYGQHPRIRILGQMESRLMRSDIIILGGVNEGVWPSEIKHDPWMSRPMRREFGLPASEQAIGFAAHDFVQNFCADRVVITRSEKSSGAPTIPSRWLERLNTLLGSSGLSLRDLSSKPYLSWVRLADCVDVKPCSRPAPCPPVSIRPRAISVTKVETWLKDPYSIYMYYMLRLKKLRPLKQENDAALKGSVLHKILDEFTHKYPKNLPDDAQEQFLNLAKETINKDVQNKEFISYWWPKLIRISDWFVEHEKKWRKDANFIESEIDGSVDFNIGGIIFNIHGRADRIDRLNDGSYAIIDYKSGGSFSKNPLLNGELPQLPLEAIMLSEGGFNGMGFRDNNADKKNKISGGKVSNLGYWKVTGGTKSGEIISINEDIENVANIVREGLENLVISFQSEKMPFYCIPDINKAPRFNDYEHVARVKEWSIIDDEQA